MKLIRRSPRQTLIKKVVSRSAPLILAAGSASTASAVSYANLRRHGNTLILDGILLASALLLYNKVDKENNPLKIKDLRFDAVSESIELGVENRGGKTITFTPRIRAVKEDDFDPMLRRGEESGAQNLDFLPGHDLMSPDMYSLISEDEPAVTIHPNERVTIIYDSSHIDTTNLNFADVNKAVVELDYDTEVGPHVVRDRLSLKKRLKHPYLRRVGVDRSFKLKSSCGGVLCKVDLLTDLVNAVRYAPSDSIAYHMVEQNDFAVWVKKVVGDDTLSERLSEVEFSSSEVAREKLLEILDSRVKELKSECLTGKHPLLKPVEPEHAFKLKRDHGEIIGEAVLLTQLRDNVYNSPPESIIFHMGDVNDYARWVEKALGDAKLSEKLGRIQLSDAEETKKLILSALDRRIRELGS